MWGLDGYMTSSHITPGKLITMVCRQCLLTNILRMNVKMNVNVIRCILFVFVECKERMVYYDLSLFFVQSEDNKYCFSWGQVRNTFPKFISFAER